MRILLNPSFGKHLLSVQSDGTSWPTLVFNTSDGDVRIGTPLSSGTYYLDLQRNDNVSDEILPHIAGISHSCFVNSDNVPKRELGEYRYKTATAMVTTGIPPKGHMLADFLCYHLEFNGKNPADVRELEKRFLFGTISAHKAFGEQPKTFRAVLELLLQEYNPKTFLEKVRVCMSVVFKTTPS